MIEIIGHIIEQYDPDSFAVQMYLTAPLLAAIVALAAGLINPVLGLAVNVVLDKIVGRISAGTIMDGIGVATGIGDIGLAGSGIAVWEGVFELFRRSVQLGMIRAQQIRAEQGIYMYNQGYYYVPRRSYYQHLPVLYYNFEETPEVGPDNMSWRQQSNPFAPGDTNGDIMRVAKIRKNLLNKLLKKCRESGHLVEKKDDGYEIKAPLSDNYTAYYYLKSFDDIFYDIEFNVSVRKAEDMRKMENEGRILIKLIIDTIK